MKRFSRYNSVEFPKKIGGVCSGIAKYFEVDPFFIRISAVGLGFLVPWVIIIMYVVTWLTSDIKTED